MYMLCALMLGFLRQPNLRELEKSKEFIEQGGELYRRE